MLFYRNTLLKKILYRYVRNKLYFWKYLWAWTAPLYASILIIKCVSALMKSTPMWNIAVHTFMYFQKWRNIYILLLFLLENSQPLKLSYYVYQDSFTHYSHSWGNDCHFEGEKNVNIENCVKILGWRMSPMCLTCL